MTALSFPSWKDKTAHLGTEYDHNTNNVLGSYTYVSYSLAGTNISISHKPDRAGVYRSGGPWTMYKRTDSRDTDYLVVYRPGATYRAYEGGFRASATYTPSFSWSETEETLHNDIFYQGALAISHLRPDMPDFTACLSLAELRETLAPLKARGKEFLLHYLKFRRNRWKKYPVNSKALANDWVALNFGWIPFVNDVISFFEAYANRDKRYQQLMRDNGRWVRRERFLLIAKSNSITQDIVHTGKSYNPNVVPTLVTQCYGGGTARSTQTTSSSSNAWCVGKAKYLLPPAKKGPGYGYRKMIIRKQLGGQITPDQLWNIVPWSWLFDYFTDIGQFLTAVAPGVADKVWFDYAYVMQTKERETEWSHTQFVRDQNNTSSSRKVTVIASRQYVSKCRAVASPFGFGLDTPSLKQSSILGALGYSRLP